MTPESEERPPPRIVVFTRDLRTHDHPALVAATRGPGEVVPCFVLDEAILELRFSSPNRLGFLIEALTDLHRSLQDLGGALVVRRGDWVGELVALARDVGAREVHVSEDVSALSRQRLERLGSALAALGATVHRHPGTTVVPPGALVPAGRNHYLVFTPYLRRWESAVWRRPAPTPGGIRMPPGLRAGSRPRVDDLVSGERASDVVPGGETEARARLNRWTRLHLSGYPDHHDDLAGDVTSRLSAYLHFGCISPLEVATKLRRLPGGSAFARQLGWRDFFHQVLAARPDAAWQDLRGPRQWRDDREGLDAWQTGTTGYPLVDAGMRQLRREGFMHNRARLVTASFLTKHLRIDWRHGARHFLDHLVDGDLANNNLSWQWVAGTGTDTSPHRMFNPTRQAQRFDPEGAYVRRYVPELRALRAPAVHDPPPADRRTCGYPDPIVDHGEAVAEYRAVRAGG